MAAEEEDRKELVADHYRGVSNPRIELDDEGSLVINLEPEASEDRRIMKPDDSVKISLESIKIDIHNQTYGLINASTGCISNPGGPSC